MQRKEEDSSLQLDVPQKQLEAIQEELVSETVMCTYVYGHCWLSRISGMEWWNGILEWNTGMT